MTMQAYGKGLEAFGNGAIDWVADDIRAILVDAASYTVSINTHDNLDDIPGGARVGSAVALASKTNTLGVLDAADFSFTGLSAAPTIEALVYYKHTGTESTSTLLFYNDGMQNITIAAAASGGATSITLDPIAWAIASGATLTKVSGSGPTTITTSGSAAAGGRSVAVSALSGAVAAGDVYTVLVSGSGFPVAAGATQVDVVVNNGADKLYRF